MLKHLRPAFTMIALMTLLTGVAYPLAITGIAQVAMPSQANGSLIDKDNAVVGSALIGQTFSSDRYFWPRPSATGPDAYNASASSGSNLGTTSAKLRDRVEGDIQRLKASGLALPLPADAVMASGSGLDPDISPEFAHAQIARVAKARGVDASLVEELVARYTAQPLFGFIGESRVNVLELNLAIDAMRT